MIRLRDKKAIIEDCYNSLKEEMIKHDYIIKLNSNLAEEEIYFNVYLKDKYATCLKIILEERKLYLKEDYQKTNNYDFWWFDFKNIYLKNVIYYYKNKRQCYIDRRYEKDLVCHDKITAKDKTKAKILNNLLVTGYKVVDEIKKEMINYNLYKEEK